MIFFLRFLIPDMDESSYHGLLFTEIVICTKIKKKILVQLLLTADL